MENLQEKSSSGGIPNHPWDQDQDHSEPLTFEDHTLRPLKAGEWCWVSASFVVSIGLFVLGLLTHSIIPFLIVGITHLPMRFYAQNRTGRVIFDLFYAVVGCCILYVFRKYLGAQFNWAPLIIMMLIAQYCWDYSFAFGSTKVNEELLKRLNELQTKMSSIQRLIEEKGQREDSE
jgi:hypothetical protein